MGMTYTPDHIMAAGTAITFVVLRKLDLSLLWWPVGLLMHIFAYWFIWHALIWPLIFSELRHVPTVPGFPLWGQFLPIVTEECGLPQRRWHYEHGPVIRYFFPLGFERLSLADEESISHVTTKNPYNFPKPLRAKLWMMRILGDGVLLAEGQEHIDQRKTLNAGFSTSAIRSFVPIFWQKSLLMVDQQQLEFQELEKDGAEEMKIDALDWLNRCTLDIIGIAGFKFELGALLDPLLPLRNAYKLVFKFDSWSRTMHGIQAFFPQSQRWPCQMNKDMEEARVIIQDKAETIIREKLHIAEKNKSGKDVLTLIAQENLKQRNEGFPGLSRDNIRDQIMTFLGAGHDTTATGAAWTIQLLANFPEVQDRLRNEIRERMPFLFNPDWHFDPDAPVTNPDLLPYLSNVCRESLRHIPPIPMTVREALQDDVIKGYKIPKGTILYMLANAINHMYWFWGDEPNDFDPDRWDDLPETVVPSAMLTFLQGPRGCIGRKFAEVEMKILLCVMLSRWEFYPDYSTNDPEDWKMWRLVLRPKCGVPMLVRPVPEWDGVDYFSRPHYDKPMDGSED